MGVHRTCGEPDEIKKNTHPKNVTALFRAQCGGGGVPRRRQGARRQLGGIHPDVVLPRQVEQQRHHVGGRRADACPTD